VRSPSIVAQYIGIKSGIPPYHPEEIAKIKGGKLFAFDFDLCIECLRCVRACQDLQHVGAIGFVQTGNKMVVGLIDETLQKSGCQFCGACVAVCPTGAMVSTSEKCGSKLSISDVLLPPPSYLDYTEQNIETAPEKEGVIHLYNERSEVIYIAGSANMKKELQINLKSAKGADYFSYKEEPMYIQP
jgi:ferredoxin